MVTTIALVRSGGRLDPATVATADGAASAYGCGSRLSDPGMCQVAWVTDEDADQLGADLASVFEGSGATVTVISQPPPPAGE